MTVTFPLCTVVDDTGAIVTGATVAITSVLDKAGSAIASHGATLNTSGANVSVDYDPETKGEAWIVLAISKAATTITGTNAAPAFYLARDSSRIASGISSAGLVALAPTQAFNNTGQTTKLPATVATGDGADAASIKSTLGTAGAGLTGLPACTLTTGERAAIATQVEAQILDETDGRQVLQAIVNKINSADANLAGLTLSAIAGAVWQDLLSGADFTTVGSIGKLLRDSIDAAISTRLASASYTAAPTAAANASAVLAALPTIRAQDAVTAPTVGDCLIAAWSGAFGVEDVAPSPITYKIKGPDGTVIRTFTLDSATAPTYRH